MSKVIMNMRTAYQRQCVTMSEQMVRDAKCTRMVMANASKLLKSFISNVAKKVKKQEKSEGSTYDSL